MLMQSRLCIICYEYYLHWRAYVFLTADSSARIYRPSFGHENARFRENMRKTLVFKSIRTHRRRFQLVLDEIRLGGSFQILGLRRVRDQLVFVHRTKQSQVVSEKWAG